MPISRFEFEEMQRRVSKGVKRAECEKSAAVDREGDLHNEIIDECERRGWLYFHSSMAARTHRTEGEPDFHIWADAGRKLAVECKSKSGKLSTKQLGIIAHAQKLGHKIHVIGNLQEFLAIINEP